jgi:hypothetical protein
MNYKAVSEYGAVMTLESLLDQAAAKCIDEREQHLVMFTQGANGYVCRNEGLTDESQALYHGSYRDCQIWIERRGIAAALQCILRHFNDVPGLAEQHLEPADLLARLSYLSK